VLDFCRGARLRDGPNPARWRGNLDAALPKASKVAKVQHHGPSGGEIGAFMRRLRSLSAWVPGLSSLRS